MNRREFFRKALPFAALPVVAAAGGAAKILDPEGEPAKDDQALILIKGDGISLNNVHVQAEARKAPTIMIGGKQAARHKTYPWGRVN